MGKPNGTKLSQSPDPQTWVDKSTEHIRIQRLHIHIALNPEYTLLKIARHAVAHH